MRAQIETNYDISDNVMKKYFIIILVYQVGTRKNDERKDPMWMIKEITNLFLEKGNRRTQM